MPHASEIVQLLKNYVMKKLLVRRGWVGLTAILCPAWPWAYACKMTYLLLLVVSTELQKHYQLNLQDKACLTKPFYLSLPTSFGNIKIILDLSTQKSDFLLFLILS